MTKFGKTALAIKDAVSGNPAITAKEVAGLLGITRQAVHGHVKNLGLKLGDGRRGRVSSPRIWTGHFGNEKKLTSHFIGGASEMIVCADLLKRGIPVYRAITFVSAADLVADMAGVLVRVEVKSVRRNQAGNINYKAPNAHRFDLLALVDCDGAVEYRPPID